MANELMPVPNGPLRATIARRARDTASDEVSDRGQPSPQRNNGEADAALKCTDTMVWAVGTFTKGLPHDPATGQVRTADLKAFVDALNQSPAIPALEGESPFPGVFASGKPAEFDVPLFDGTYLRCDRSPPEARGWESPISGHTFDLEGADADAVGMPPAPELGSSELTAEMAEVYAAALIRDKPFSSWRTGAADAVLVDLNELPFFSSGTGLDEAAKQRRSARLKDDALSHESLFRGSTPGAMCGPYISQFLLIGNAERQGDSGAALDATDAQPRAQKFAPQALKDNADDDVKAADGLILYGVQAISQQFRVHKEHVDHMTDWAMWLDVQNAANRKNSYDQYEKGTRFISTPRDLATYVHFDALYQAYLNATLILLGMSAQTDIGLPEGGKQKRDAFATFGGPHILTLVTEVATRALKAVRRQKYNIHLRSRPEALAAAVSLAWKGGAAAECLGDGKVPCQAMATDLEPILEDIQEHNEEMNDRLWQSVFGSIEHGPLDESRNALLPMAFPEGSPMHADYGAGHATVAGACVTIVKAFFEMFEHSNLRGDLALYDIVDKASGYPARRYPEELFGTEKALTGDCHLPYPLEPCSTDATKLVPVEGSGHVSIQGELDKLAANISIGRNFAGVHFYTDYYESLRMGERVAVSMLQEQMLTYREPVTMRFTTFDGDKIMVAGTGGTRGDNDALVFVWNENGASGRREDFHEWWNRHR